MGHAGGSIDASSSPPRSSIYSWASSPEPPGLDRSHLIHSSLFRSHRNCMRRHLKALQSLERSLLQVLMFYFESPHEVRNWSQTQLGVTGLVVTAWEDGGMDDPGLVG